MSEMVERVAKAIADYWHEHGFDPSEPNPDVARAAIEAMREPTDAMVEPTREMDIYWRYRSDGTPGAPQDVWHAMIDAALSTETVS